MRDPLPILLCAHDADLRELAGYLALSLALPVIFAEPLEAFVLASQKKWRGILWQLPAGEPLALPVALPPQPPLVALLAPPDVAAADLPFCLPGVDYLLPASLVDWELRAILQALGDAKPPLSAIGSDSYLQELSQGYLETMPAKLVELEGLLRAWRQGRKAETLSTFVRECHKLAGSAGSYGFPEATDLCRLLESRLNHHLSEGCPADPRLELDLTLFPRQLRLAFMRLVTW
jgi:HPt (histidine-containing phosphotransfer) domain-containing protein